MPRVAKTESIVVSALKAGANFGDLLRRLENERRSFVIEKGGTSRAVMMSIRDYVRLAAPEPEVLSVIGQESKTTGTDKLTSKEIDAIVRSVRAKKRIRRK